MVNILVLHEERETWFEFWILHLYKHTHTHTHIFEKKIAFGGYNSHISIFVPVVSIYEVTKMYHTFLLMS